MRCFYCNQYMDKSIGDGWHTGNIASFYLKCFCPKQTYHLINDQISSYSISINLIQLKEYHPELSSSIDQIDLGGPIIELVVANAALIKPNYKDL